VSGPPSRFLTDLERHPSRPEQRPHASGGEHDAVITHLSYWADSYKTAAECLEDIARRLDAGWQLVDVVGDARQGYLAIFRRERAPQ